MKFRILNLVTVLILIMLYFAATPWWAFVITGWVYVSIVFWGCIRISSGFFLPVACHAKTDEKVVALTFDDGPNPAFTPQILDTLKKYAAPATFFCIGKNIVGNEALLHRIKNEGHIIGNHSFSHHFWFDLFGSGKMLTDIKQMDEAVVRETGLKPKFFRPPYGVTNPNVRKAVNKGNYDAVGWSIRSLDTAVKDKQKLLLRITGQIKAGDVILLHDSVGLTANILPDIIEQIQNKGFRIAPLDKMLNLTAYA